LRYKSDFLPIDIDNKSFALFLKTVYEIKPAFGEIINTVHEICLIGLSKSNSFEYEKKTKT
jgi:hypothetical protein